MKTYAKMHTASIIGTGILMMIAGVGANAKPAVYAHRQTVPGGANQVDGLRGKIGDMLFDGYWRFKVQDIQAMHSYTLTVPTSAQDVSRYSDVADLDDDSHTFTPKDGYKLVAVKCYVKNGQKHTEELDEYSNDPKTAITDSDQNSYPPIAYDMATSIAWITKDLLPGSGENITVLFAVPKSFEPKDLVFTLKSYSNDTAHHARVDLR